MHTMGQIQLNIIQLVITNLYTKFDRNLCKNYLQKKMDNFHKPYLLGKDL